MKKDIVDEFLDGADTYAKTLNRCDEGTCFVCGMRADNFIKLVKAVKVLQEKAWKYDELSE